MTASLCNLVTPTATQRMRGNDRSNKLGLVSEINEARAAVDTGAGPPTLRKLTNLQECGAFPPSRRD